MIHHINLFPTTSTVSQKHISNHNSYKKRNLNMACIILKQLRVVQKEMELLLMSHVT